MRKYLLLLAGIIAAPFVGSKTPINTKKLESTVELAKKASGKESNVEIKPLNRILLAPQDIGGDPSGKGRNRGKASRSSKKTFA
jgi:hypothetical protein